MFGLSWLALFIIYRMNRLHQKRIIEWLNKLTADHRDDGGCAGKLIKIYGFKAALAAVREAKGEDWHANRARDLMDMLVNKCKKFQTDGFEQKAADEKREFKKGMQKIDEVFKDMMGEISKSGDGWRKKPEKRLKQIEQLLPFAKSQKKRDLLQERDLIKRKLKNIRA